MMSSHPGDDGVNSDQQEKFQAPVSRRRQRTTETIAVLREWFVAFQISCGH